jgi:hypothetical protein
LGGAGGAGGVGGGTDIFLCESVAETGDKGTAGFGPGAGEGGPGGFGGRGGCGFGPPGSTFEIGNGGQGLVTVHFAYA